MDCIICGNKTTHVLTQIKGVTILECASCELGITVPPSKQINKTDLPYDFAEYRKQEKRYFDRVEAIVTHLSKHKSSGHTLDIGGGFGLLSSILIDKGYTVDTIEPYLTPEYLKNNEKANIIRLDLDTYLEHSKSTYDLIIMLDVLEHLTDPVEILKKLKKKLSKEGIIVLQMPNYKSVMANICRDWSWWMIDDHLFHFSPKSLQLIAKKTDLELVELHTYEEYQDFRKNLDGNFMHVPQPFRKIQKAVFFALFTPIYLLMRTFIWQTGSGGLLFAILRG